MVRELLSHVGDPIPYPTQKRRPKKQKVEKAQIDIDDQEERIDRKEVDHIDQEDEQHNRAEGIQEENSDDEGIQVEEEQVLIDIEKEEDDENGDEKKEEEEQDAISRLGLPRELVLEVLNCDDNALKQSMLGKGPFRTVVLASAS